MNRRASLKGLTAMTGVSLSGSLATGLLQSCGAFYDPGYQPVFFSKSQDRQVALLVDMIIPATDTPGAEEVGVNQFIDAILGRHASDEEQELFLSGLLELDERSKEISGRIFVKASGGERKEVLTRLDEASRSGQSSAQFYRYLKMLTLYGYYTSEVGASQELIYQHNAGEWKADIPYQQVGKSYS